MKKLLAAVAIAALGSAASAQTLTPAPEVTQAPRFSAGAGFGSMGNTEAVVGGLLLLVMIGLIASSDDDDNGSTTVFK